MKLLLLRHGQTAYNRAMRYQGVSDIPLSPEGRAALGPACFCPERVYTSPLRRAEETARIFFPSAELLAVDGLQEMNFGAFEGRTALEMENDPAYAAWLASGGTRRCPLGESRAEFVERTCTAFCALVEQALARGETVLVLVAHGGTQISLLSRFGRPSCSYSTALCAPNGGGYACVLEPPLWRAEHCFTVTQKIQNLSHSEFAASFFACASHATPAK